MSNLSGVRITGPLTPASDAILTPDAITFLAGLERRFRAERAAILADRKEVQRRLDAGWRPTLPPETARVREGSWTIAPVPPPLQYRRVEITGPTDRKMVINALNSGAQMFMADFEDANSPTWFNLVTGQQNLIDAIERRITFDSPDGRRYRLNPEVATLLVRPRGWHLVERHVLIDDTPMSASLFDFGLFVFHNGRRLLDKGFGPYFYLPKLEHYREARLWNAVFSYAEDELALPRGSIRATVLIETILAAFQMDEILYELREHAAGLNAGRWDYIFSVIKKMGRNPAFVLPDRAQVTMTVPFMRAYTTRLVETCHRRGAWAIGGMSAFIPNRRQTDVNARALAAVREDKLREARDGFDGTWVAHPDLVPVAAQAFADVLGSERHQLSRRPDIVPDANALLDAHIEGGRITQAGLHNNVSVALQYLESWLRGQGAVAIFNLMEDTATAEISRSQIWQWIYHQVRLEDGRAVNRELVRDEITAALRELPDHDDPSRRYEAARSLLEEVSLSNDFVEFLTYPAYDHLVD
jgi:malate synthase